MTHYILVLISTFFWGCQENSNNKSTNHVNSFNDSSAKSNIEEYVYSPSGCLFQVKFLAQPKILSESSLDDVNLEKAENAQLEIESQESFVKAEFLLLKSEINDQAVMRGVIKKYAVLNGLNNVSIDFTQNEMGNVFELRGFKTLQNGNNPLQVTYTAKYYFNKNTIFILYAGCPSTIYPSAAISNFYNSLKKK